MEDALDNHHSDKENEITVVFAANAVVDPRAVVVKPVDTDITDSAVLASLRFGELASYTQVRAANGASSKCLHVDLL